MVWEVEMKKKILCSILVFIVLFMIIGCSKKDEPVKEQEEKKVTSTPTIKSTNIEPNARVGYLRFYAPSDYTYRSDLRGLAYSESEKKVYIKGNYESNPNSVIYLISALEFSGKDVNEYVNEINAKLTDNDVKFTLKTNEKKQEIYVRENYVIGNNVNYAYILCKSGDIYVVNIKGPQVEKDEITKTATNVYNSLFIS